MKKKEREIAIEREILRDKETLK